MRVTSAPPLLALLIALVALPSCGGDGSIDPGAPTGSPTAPSPVPSPDPTETTQPTEPTVTASVFFPNTQLGDPCGEVFPVPRRVSAAAPLAGALEALLAGPTEAEVASGYGGWFSEATVGLLDDVDVEGARAYVSFDATLPRVIPNASSSCGSFGLLAQLDRTVTQFDAVDEAWYSLAGDRVDFYAWLQLAAPDDGGPIPPPSPPPTDRPSPTPSRSETPPPQPPPSSDRNIPPSLLGGEWSTLPSTRPVVALTFDAGANADAIPSVLATLADTGTPATFFLTGNWVTAYPVYSSRIGARYPVGNHTRSHPDLTRLSDAAVREQLNSAEDMISAATGRTTVPWFRFPFGARNDHLLDLVNGLGYGSVRWTVDTLGWKGTSAGMTADGRGTRAGGAPPGRDRAHARRVAPDRPFDAGCRRAARGDPTDPSGRLPLRHPR